MTGGLPFREISAFLHYNGGNFDSGGIKVYSKEYEEAKKEFKNCLWMSVFGLGIPIYNAIHEWLPIMRRERQRALEDAASGKEASK